MSFETPAAREIRIEHLHIYPLKSAHGIDLSEAKITANGFEWDRNWLLSRPTGELLSQRDVGAEKMALVHVELDFAKDVLRLSAPSQAELILELHPQQMGPERDVNVHGNTCHGFDEGEKAAAWFSDYLGMAARLVRVDLSRGRINDSLYTGHERVRSAGQDGFQYLITSQESLAAFNVLLKQAGNAEIPMSRFRPNIEISGLGAFEEDGFEDVRHLEREIHLRMVKPCGRCKIINVDQETGEFHRKQPVLSTLASVRTFKNKGGQKNAMFGQNAIAESGIGKVLKVGDVLLAYQREVSA